MLEVHGSVEVEVDGTAAAVTAVLLTAVVAVLGDEVQGLRFPQSAEPKMVTTPSPSTAIRILIPNGIRTESIPRSEYDMCIAKGSRGEPS